MWGLNFLTYTVLWFLFPTICGYMPPPLPQASPETWAEKAGGQLESVKNTDLISSFRGLESLSDSLALLRLTSRPC